MFFTVFACQGKQTDRPLMTPKYDGVVAMSPHSMHSTFKRKIRDEVSELHQEQEAVSTQISSFQEMYCSGIPFESKLDQTSEHSLCLLLQDTV